MKSFHGDQKIKDKYIARVEAHRIADEIVKGKYWEGGKGCAIGCTIHGSDHSRYEDELGIPEWLARLKDSLFEGMPNREAKEWAGKFLKATPIGVDLDQIKTPFIVIILEHSIVSMKSAIYDQDAYPLVKLAIDKSIKAVEQMIDAKKSGDQEKISAAWSAAESARSAARSAAWSAAESARSAWSAAESARSAAESAARSASWSAAESAWSAARSAAWSAAESARSAWSAAESARSASWSAAESASWSAAESAWSAAESAARSVAYLYYSEKLLELLRGAR